MFIFPVKRFIEQHGGKNEVLLVSAVDLEDHDLLLIVAVDGVVYPVACCPSNAGGVELQWFCHKLARAVYPHCHTEQDTFLLKLVDHPRVIRVAYKINIYPSFVVGIKIYFADQTHVAAIHRHDMIVPVVFVNEIIASDFSEYIEIGAFVVITLRF
jgi:hypothetical protein